MRFRRVRRLFLRWSCSRSSEVHKVFWKRGLGKEPLFQQRFFTNTASFAKQNEHIPNELCASKASKKRALFYKASTPKKQALFYKASTPKKQALFYKASTPPKNELCASKASPPKNKYKKRERFLQSLPLLIIKQVIHTPVHKPSGRQYLP